MNMTAMRFAALLLASALVNAEELTTDDAIYTESQAQEGERLYDRHCLTCHDKKYFKPVFRTWAGQPLGILYTIMSTSMPQTNPGALPRKDYVDILAYLLALNRYPAGNRELDYRDNALDRVLITEP